MNLWAKRLWEIAIILSILSPSATVSALSETRPANDSEYERLQHEFVLSSRNEVIVYCDAGDSVVKGSCEARTQNIVSDQVRYLNDMPRGNANRNEGFVDNRLFESREVTDLGRTGFACRVKIVRADQEMRVTAALKCRKATDKTAQTRKPVPQI